MSGRKKEDIAVGSPDCDSTSIILESISDGVFTVDKNWRITSFNRAAEEITGVDRKAAVGSRCADVFRSSMCETGCALKETMKTGRPIIGREAFIVNAEGERIPVSVSTALLKDEKGRIIGGAETFRDLSLVEDLRKAVEGRREIGDMVSKSPLMQKVFSHLPAIASSPSTVLILGETGVGKELLARAIHELDDNRKGPFVAVNCGALPDTLLEAELFGYKKGAFTGAARDKPGRLAMAAGGTLFLDEIGDVSPAFQIRLLRVLQERVFEPLGSVRSEKVNARFIFATNRDIDAMVADGSFRKDLYYRINVVRLTLPPLRERKEDIPLLVQTFIGRFNRLMKKNVQGVTTAVLSAFMAHDWPGNIRELENVIERAFILCDHGLIGVEHLPDEFVSRGVSLRPDSGIRSAKAKAEAEAILKALDGCGYNRSATARKLGIHPSTLYRKMKRLGIHIPDNR